MDKGILWRAGLVLGFALIIWAGYSSSSDMRDGATAQQGKRYDQAIAIYEQLRKKVLGYLSGILKLERNRKLGTYTHSEMMVKTEWMKPLSGGKELRKAVTSLRNSL